MSKKVRCALFIAFISVAIAAAWIYALNFAPEIHIR